jgi:hypothetical protein
MAQFSHPDFGGMSQWSHGMTMVGDMFNDGLKSKLDAGLHRLAAYVVQSASTDPSAAATTLRSAIVQRRRFRLVAR